MCSISRRNIHSGIGENGLQPIEPSAASWDEMRAPFSLSALRERDGASAPRKFRSADAANDASTGRKGSEARRAAQRRIV